jgi:hypothetical protein
MNLFRSEEHVRNWSGFKSDTEEGMIPVLDMAAGFSGNLFTKRLDSDYVSHLEEYMKEAIGGFQALGSFWEMPG